MASNDAPYRRRGRPSGKNRVPLSLDERRARNAQYERERRNETSEAMVQLAEAAGCGHGLNNADILASVINQLQRASEQNSSDDIQELRRINEKLILQIQSIEERMSNWEDIQNTEPVNEDENIEKNRKRHSKKPGHSSKRRKTSRIPLDVTLTPTSNNDF